MARVPIPVAAAEKLLRTCEAERVSDAAAVALRDLLEAETKRIARQAWQLAEHSKRKTIMKNDVRFVLEHLKR